MAALIASPSYSVNFESLLHPAEVSDMVATLARTISADEYPHLHEHRNQHVSEGPHRDVSTFEFGLDLILDGLKKIHDTETARPSPG
jgi:hypothetical protein